MRHFKDNFIDPETGTASPREWSISITVGSIEQVRTEWGVDLSKLYHDDTAANLFGDVCLMVNVIHTLVRSQCDLLKVSPISFGEAMTGDALDAASECLWQGVIDFFPSRQRPQLAKILEAGKINADKIDKALETMTSDQLATATLAVSPKT